MASLLRGAGTGAFVFDLIDFGAVPGQQYELVRFGQQVGFGDGDFTFAGDAGIGGVFSLAQHSLLFTASVVPEPHTTVLCLAGLLLLSQWRGRQRLRATFLVRHFS